MKGMLIMTIKETRKTEGLCLYCGGKIDREGPHCKSCNDKYNEWKRNHTQYYHIVGKCTNCGKEVNRDGWLCRECANKANAHGRERNAYRRANNLCVQCCSPTDGHSQCRDCLDKLADRRNKKRMG